MVNEFYDGTDALIRGSLYRYVDKLEFSDVKINNTSKSKHNFKQIPIIRSIEGIFETYAFILNIVDKLRDSWYNKYIS